MGFKQIRTSDLTGAVLEDNNVLTVIVKSHPDLGGENKVFDTSQEELKDLKTVEGLVELEVKDVAGNTHELFVNTAELAKVIPVEKLKSFDNARGRRTGFRPNGNGG